MPRRWYVRPTVHVTASLAALLAVTAPAAAQAGQPAPVTGPRYINPPGLTRPSGYTHVVVSSDGQGGVTIVAREVPSPLPECLVPVTTVALVELPAG